jgi:hypothetical protein
MERARRVREQGLEGREKRRAEWRGRERERAATKKDFAAHLRAMLDDPKLRIFH